ncbi:hypothetical protein DMENIID0001_123740 [Sergentomyia squamirostris]
MAEQRDDHEIRYPPGGHGNYGGGGGGGSGGLYMPPGYYPSPADMPPGYRDRYAPPGGGGSSIDWNRDRDYVDYRRS